MVPVILHRKAPMAQEDQHRLLGRTLLATGAVALTLITAGEIVLLRSGAETASSPVACENIAEDAGRLVCYDARAHRAPSGSFKTTVPPTLYRMH